MVDMRIVRLVKDAASGGGSFATIDKPQDVIKLAGVLAPLDVVEQFGVIFASAFPGYNRFAEAAEGYALDRGRRESLLAVEAMRARMTDEDPATAEVDVLIKELRETLEREPYQFDRRFLFQALSFGHAQFAEIIGARGV